jgi:hypothetical protein
MRDQMSPCLIQHVKLTVKGETHDLTLEPAYNRYLYNALHTSEALRVIVSSSDLSRVKVTRRDPHTGIAVEFTEDARSQESGNRKYSDNLLLREGDEIEVPEK